MRVLIIVAIVCCCSLLAEQDDTPYKMAEVSATMAHVNGRRAKVQMALLLVVSKYGTNLEMVHNLGKSESALMFTDKYIADVLGAMKWYVDAVNRNVVPTASSMIIAKCECGNAISNPVTGVFDDKPATMAVDFNMMCNAFEIVIETGYSLMIYADDMKALWNILKKTALKVYIK